MDLDNKYTYLYNSFHNANSKAFLTFHLLRELHLLYNGRFHGAITNYATYWFTAMTNLNIDTLKDPFKELISESMLNYLGRFCVRIERELFFQDLISKDLIGGNGLPLPLLPEATMKKFFEYVHPSNKFLTKDTVILRTYYEDCRELETRTYFHSLPEVKRMVLKNTKSPGCNSSRLIGLPTRLIWVDLRGNKNPNLSLNT